MLGNGFMCHVIKRPRRCEVSGNNLAGSMSVATAASDTDLGEARRRQIFSLK